MTFYTGINPGSEALTAPVSYEEELTYSLVSELYEFAQKDFIFEVVASAYILELTALMDGYSLPSQEFPFELPLTLG